MAILFRAIAKVCVAAALILILAPPFARAQLYTLSSITGWWDYDGCVHPAGGSGDRRDDFGQRDHAAAGNLWGIHYRFGCTSDDGRIFYAGGKCLDSDGSRYASISW